MSLPASTYGDRFVVAVREYLHQNGLKSLGQINAKILGELSQRFHEKDEAANKTLKKLASEEEWLKEKEGDPAFSGIDIRRQLGIAQTWCKDRNRICTRRFFNDWLIREAQKGPVVRSYDGATSKPRIQVPKAVLTPEKPVPGWPLILRNQVTGIADEQIDAFCASDWKELPQQIRQLIVQSA